MSFRFVVTKNDEDRRLDKTLRSIWKDLSSGHLMKAIRKGQVRINGKKVHASYRLVRDDKVIVPWDGLESPRQVLRRPELDIVYSDRDFVFINKPSGLLSQPSRKNEDSAVTRAWACYEGYADNLSFRPAAVNRLDRNTSGLMVIALNGRALRDMQLVFKNKLAEKHYYAVVIGRAPSFGVIDRPLSKDPESNTVKIRDGGKDSITRFNLVTTNGKVSLLDVTLVTGRSHQARAHLSWVGMPLLGDPKYGDPESNGLWRREGIKRPMLHSFSIKFLSLEDRLAAFSGKIFTAPLPKDLERLITTLNWTEMLSNMDNSMP